MSWKSTHALPKLWKGFEYQHHQITGVQWMCRREDDRHLKGGLLCDEMGLGKTIQMLALIRCRPVPATLLLTPVGVLHQWEETASHCGLDVWKPNKKKTAWEPPDAGYYPQKPQIYLANYEMVMAHPELIEEVEWNRLICDEAHRLANMVGRAFEFMKNFPAERTWLLTATPIVNSMKDATGLFTILGVGKMRHPPENPAREFVLCRTMTELRDRITYLPAPALETHHSLDFDTEAEQEFYRGIQGTIVRQWQMLVEDGGHATSFFKLILRLRQISTHPQVYISSIKSYFPAYSRPDWAGPSTKFCALRRQIELEMDTPHRWLVFCHFRLEMELLRDYLQGTGLIGRCQIYNGELTHKEKKAVLEETLKPLNQEAIWLRGGNLPKDILGLVGKFLGGRKQEVLLVQLRAGGVGLNLQHFDRIAFMGPWWTAALMDQAIGRAVRIGQKKQVHVHHFILKEEETLNIDRKMLEKAEGKRLLCNAFLAEAQHLL